MGTLENIEKQGKAYLMLFNLENHLRIAMHNTLVAKKGPEYFNPDSLPAFKSSLFGLEYEYNLVEAVTSNKTEESKIKLSLGYDFPCLWYLDLTTLLALLNEFWDTIFQNIFIQPKELHKELLKYARDLRLIRNSIAHNRFISDAEYFTIHSFHELVLSTINKDSISNFNEIVFTAANEYESILIAIVDKILFNLNQGNTIKNDLIKNFQRVFSLIGQIRSLNTSVEDIDTIIESIKRYNQCSRKPGGMSGIKTLLKETNLCEKLSYIKMKGI